MKVEAVTKETLEAFYAYCRLHRTEVDDSYLYEEDLAAFCLGQENPTYIGREEGKIVAAASLILDDYHRRGKRGRFRIFHSEKNCLEDYQSLFEVMKPHLEGIEYVIVFVPDEDPQMAAAMDQLGFYVERASCLLVRETNNLKPSPPLPDNYSLQAFRPGVDETNWVNVRNQAFANLLGSQTPLFEEQVAEMIKAEDHLPDGMLILFYGDQAVGIVRGTVDEYEEQPIMNIGPLAVLPSHQGRGLGRYLLRSVVAFGKKTGYDRVVLCVNAENENAKALYLKEGFVQVEGVRCFRWDQK